jgi:hypothetical protein
MKSSRVADIRRLKFKEKQQTQQEAEEPVPGVSEAAEEASEL